MDEKTKRIPKVLIYPLFSSIKFVLAIIISKFYNSPMPSGYNFEIDVIISTNLG